MKPAFLSTLFSLLAFYPMAEARTFSLPTKSAAPGSEVVFPLSLDVATGCASIQIEINYDVGMLSFVRFENSTGLGSQFSPTSFAENGVITMIWTRATGLLSGSGTLGRVRFRVNSGAKEGAFTPLAISNCETSDETGVVEFALTENVSLVSGGLAVSAALLDSDTDGIPNAWETANLLDPSVSNFSIDSDQDGRSDFLEYAFGGNPRGNDAVRSPSANSVMEMGVKYLSLSFDRRPGANLVYRVMESSSLGTWEEVVLPARMVGIPLNHGDGTERVTVRSRFRIGGAGGSPTGFMKVEVERP